MLEKLRNIFQVPELRRRILFTLAMFVIFFWPSSPSLRSFSKYGTTAPSSWRMIEAEMYGMIPSANTVARENAPPTNMSYRPNIVFAWLRNAPAKAAAFTPGVGRCSPSR